MDSTPGSYRWMHGFACLLAAATFLLIVAGANVTSHRAGLSVPDWPTTYGQFMFSFPASKWVGNILYEHGHRLIASVVGMLTVMLAFWLVRVEPRRWVRRLGIGALAAVIAQGVLGGLTVILMLPSSISIAHASLAEAFFCITVTLAFVTSEKWRQPAPLIDVSDARMAQRSALASTIAVYAQIILGAAIRHDESGVFPHVLGALVVLGCVVVVLVAAKHPGLLRHAIFLLGLVAVQIVLGLITLMVRVPKNADMQLSTAQILIPTTHLALGALVLATSLLMTLRTYRFLATASEAPSLPLAQGAPS
ncbi:MAG TPA: COX15/CtaA family protein [Verrucomicrobiae bacterium]|nr:COX15/CtaA family protein [Verrucomicrobiae bacterium]